MNKVTFEADRWFLSAVSPQPFEKLPDAEHVAVIHPGWAKDPDHYGSLMLSLEEAGVFSITVDTRYGYANQNPVRRVNSASPWFRVLLQQYNTGDTNRFFPDSRKVDNRGRLRKASATLAVCEALGIKSFHMIGHSDGGRTATLVAEAAPEQVESLTLVNAVGTGSATSARAHAASRSVMGVVRDKQELLHEGIKVGEIVVGGLHSAAYALSHPRRVRTEYATIRSAHIWPKLEEIAREIPVHVLQGRADPLISFYDAYRNARNYPEILFTPADGGHNNFYRHSVQEQIVAGLNLATQK